ncbi:hypothetical protein Mgra_00008261 [Meloidogyne graminicola]|uniref:GDP-fucose pyrophosphorylase domain-containing protein n=1 Tax=Meloidogyne graminicola TaxID=189291 RepID=A0A8S9ZG91_9BILA|nr:hypothetical protein Mgra_00008261 [Meloidogyne graminicola]
MEGVNEVVEDNIDDYAMSEDEIASLRSSKVVMLFVIRSKISSFSLKKLSELKAKIGLDLFNKIMFGKSVDSNVDDNPTGSIQTKKVGGTHRPREESSVRPPSRLRKIKGLELRKPKNVDPRFADSSGEFDQIAFHRDYSFIEDLRRKDIQELQNAYKQQKIKGSNPKKLERIKKNLIRLRNQQKAFQNQKLKEDVLAELRQTNIERMNSGQKPIYLNNNELKEKFLTRKNQQKQQHKELTCQKWNNFLDNSQWDCILLTARNKKQKQIFNQQLKNLQLKERNFCKEYFVLADEPEGVKIGSGGATFNALLFFKQYFGNNIKNTRLLLLHNGGLSQRIPHVALIGKAFMLMPDGKTLLEHKLIIYKKLLNYFFNFGGFLFVTSADVLEYFPNNFFISNISKEIDLLLIAHQSTLDIATQHGVFVMNDEKIEKILQKPTINKLRKTLGAILPPNEFIQFETALTDSCYFIGPKIIEDLIKIRKENGEIICELCCYRDFLCPIELFKWQKILWNEFNKLNPKIISLGINSFFHFGTVGELLSHFFIENSPFRMNFLHNNKEIGNIVNCLIENPEKISQKSFVEWCKLNSNCNVEDNCILSGVIYEEKISICIKSGMYVCTFPIGGDEEKEELKYVTIIFHINDNLKKIITSKMIYIEGEEEKEYSLWNCPLFSAYSTPSLSFLNTIESINYGLNNLNSLLSIAQILEKANVNKMLIERNKLINRKNLIN